MVHAGGPRSAFAAEHPRGQAAEGRAGLLHVRRAAAHSQSEDERPAQRCRKAGSCLTAPAERPGLEMTSAIPVGQLEATAMLAAWAALMQLPSQQLHER